MAELSLVAYGASANLVYAMIEKLLTRRSAQIYKGSTWVLRSMFGSTI